VCLSSFLSTQFQDYLAPKAPPNYFKILTTSSSSLPVFFPVTGVVRVSRSFFTC
jgi:hypothetical protein